MIEKSSLTKLLRLIAATIEGLDQVQIDQLIAGKGKLTFTAPGKPKETTITPTTDLAALLAKLNDCASRDDARQALSAIANRDALEAFARTMKIHVVKHDRRENIESKIVEFVIGGKLRTEAIQSLNLKGGGSPSDGG